MTARKILLLATAMYAGFDLSNPIAFGVPSVLRSLWLASRSSWMRFEVPLLGWHRYSLGHPREALRAPLVCFLWHGIGS